jgi:Na+-driven multidrug efflux pump
MTSNDDGSILEGDIGCAESQGEGEDLIVSGSSTEGVRSHHPSCIRCATSLISLSGPSMMAFALEFAFQSVSIAFVGSFLGSDAIAATSIAVTSFNIAGSSVGIGLGLALDTLCSQEFGRGRNSSQLGLYLQQNFFIQLLVVLYSCILFNNSHEILRVIFNESLAAGASEYLRHSVPTLAVMLAVVSINRFLSAQCITKYTMYAVAVSAGLCPAYNYYLIGFGIKGAAWALGASYGTQLIVLLLLCSRNKSILATWGGLRLRSAITAEGLKVFIALGLPSPDGNVINTSPQPVSAPSSSTGGAYTAAIVNTLYC